MPTVEVHWGLWLSVLPSLCPLQAAHFQFQTHCSKFFWSFCWQILVAPLCRIRYTCESWSSRFIKADRQTWCIQEILWTVRWNSPLVLKCHREIILAFWIWVWVHSKFEIVPKDWSGSLPDCCRISTKWKSVRSKESPSKNSAWVFKKRICLLKTSNQRNPNSVNPKDYPFHRRSQ